MGAGQSSNPISPDAAQRLLKLNELFYREFGAQFSATRQRIQPGVRKILADLHGDEHILDLGCGNGELARSLAQNGFHGSYTGLDFSPPLLQDASAQPAQVETHFLQANLALDDWEKLLEPQRYSLISAFAVLHHIPGRALREKILRQVAHLLAPGGQFILSNWQFLNSERLKKHILPWQTAGFSSSELDEGDYLLDWRSGGSGLRYAHHFSVDELNELAVRTGFVVVGSFLADGENERLGLYQVWELAS